MIYIFRNERSTGARFLAEALNGRRIIDSRTLLRLVRPNDTVVCWGSTIEGLPAGVRTINNVTLHNKFTDAVRLREADVPTIEVSRERPVQQTTQAPDPLPNIWEDAQGAVEAFLDVQPVRTPVAVGAVGELVALLQRVHQAMQTPPPPPVAVMQGEWLPRDANHVGGTDLITPPQRPDFWVKKETLIREYRVHSFGGRSIRGGVKVPREGVATPHEWVRSWDGGWRISYADGAIHQAQRDIAHQAVQALGLTFGAVDIGQKADGSMLVLEVNRAPGLEGGTPEAYARAINRWVEEQR